MDNKLPNAREFDHSTREGRNAYLRAHRKALPDLYADKDLRRTFGITLVDYEAMLVAQNGKCAICGKPETSMRGGKLKRLAVDHNHETGELRGLLCTNCNPMIGYAKEDADRLRAAIRYLESHSGKEKVIPLRIVKESA